MKTFLFWLLQFTWCILQNIIGGFMYLILKLNKKNKYMNYYYAKIIEFPNNNGSVSLGAFLMLYPNASIKTAQHEYGHCIQSMILGPLYLFVIGIPSIIWAGCFKKYRKNNNISYYSFYTEKWADKLGGVER